MTACPYLIVAASVLAVGLAACQGCRSSDNRPGNLPAAEPNVGTPTLRLYLVTDLAGALEPCGCTKDQLGGLDHFGAAVRGEHGRAPTALVAAAGPLFFMDEKLETERADQDRAKADTIARVLHRLDFAAFAPGANDWADGESALTKLATVSGASVILGEGSAAPPFVWSLVRQVGGVKVGFVGFSQPPPGQGSSTLVEETVARGAEAAKRQGANVLIALVAVGRGEAKRIADAVPDLTAVVVGAARSSGDANTSAPQGERVGGVLVAQAANHLQSVAVLDLYVREQVSAGHIVQFADATGLELAQKRADLTERSDELHAKLTVWERDRNVVPSDIEARRVELASLEAERERLDAKPPPAQGSFFRYAIKEVRDSLGKDPVIEADMLAYYKTVDEHNRTAFADRLPVRAGPGEARYVGVEACTSCHAAARKAWDATAHARAYATLSTQYKEFNLECVGCHVTGYERPGGSTVTHVDRLRDVQCETCHGPGSQHVARPADQTLIVAKPQPDSCLTCHRSPHVEHFDPVARMGDILGPGHGM